MKVDFQRLWEIFDILEETLRREKSEQKRPKGIASNITEATQGREVPVKAAD